MSRASGLAVVAYGLTTVGFVQVAVTIAPHIAATVPAAGAAAPAVGAAVALAVDVVWAALMHTTITTYRNGQHRPALGFGAATMTAVLASTILLAAVGHQGPWSVVPFLAALLLVADGLREHVTVSPETAATIRERTAEIRDARALAAIEARRAAHDETIAGYAEASRLAARTGALAEIKTTVQRAEWQASRRITKATQRYGEIPAEAPVEFEAVARSQIQFSPVESRDVAPIAPPATPATRLTVVQRDTVTDDDIDTRIRELVAQGAKPAEIAKTLELHKATVYRRLAKIKEA